VLDRNLFAGTLSPSPYQIFSSPRNRSKGASNQVFDFLRVAT